MMSRVAGVESFCKNKGKKEIKNKMVLGFVRLTVNACAKYFHAACSGVALDVMVWGGFLSKQIPIQQR